MTEPRVIRADFANWRPVAGRKVLQLILEVPIEQTADVMEKLGFPLPGESKWVAVALLDENGPVAELVDAADLKSADESRVGSNPTGAHHKERKPFASLPLSQQAAIRCGDPDFRKFLARNDKQILMYDADMAADEVRHQCGVTTRGALNDVNNASARAQWTALDAQYQSWRTDLHYLDARR